MVNFHYKASIVDNLDDTIAFIKSAYTIRYTSPTREASEGLLQALTDFGVQGLRHVYNSLIEYACLDKKLKMPKDEAIVEFYVSKTDALFEELDNVQAFVTAAVNDSSVMAADKKEREAAVFQLERAANRLRRLIKSFEEAK